MNEYPSVLSYEAVSKKTWAEPKHLNIHNKIQYMNCYESLPKLKKRIDSRE